MEKQQEPLNQSGRFESDVTKLVHRHLSDQAHVITEEELATVRVGMSPPPDAPTQALIQEISDGEENGALTGA